MKPNVNGITLARKFDSTITGLDVLNDSIQTVVGQFNRLTGDFRISHPTRLVLNVDRQITDLIYINAELSIPIKALPADKYFQTQDFNLLTITPRRESQNMGSICLCLLQGKEVLDWCGGKSRSCFVWIPPCAHWNQDFLSKWGSLSCLHHKPQRKTQEAQRKGH